MEIALNELSLLFFAHYFSRLSPCYYYSLFFKACTKTRNNETKRPKRNHRNERNETTETRETTETAETKQPKRPKRAKL